VVPKVSNSKEQKEEDKLAKLQTEELEM